MSDFQTTLPPPEAQGGAGGQQETPPQKTRRPLSEQTKKLVAFAVFGAVVLGFLVYSNWRGRKNAQTASRVQVSQPEPQSAPPLPVVAIGGASKADQPSSEALSEDLDARLAFYGKQLRLLQTQAALQQARYQLQDLRVNPSLKESQALSVPVTPPVSTTPPQGGQAPPSLNPGGALAPPGSFPSGKAEGGTETYSKVTRTDPGDSQTDAVLRAGTFLDAVLENELTTDNADSPVVALVNRDYYDPLSRRLLMPAGTRLVGKAQKVEYQTASRLAITMNLFQFPNGTNFHVAPFTTALESYGVYGLMDEVNRHTARILLMSGAVGLLMGFNQAQVEGGTGGAYSGTDLMRLQANQQVTSTAQMLLQPFLNAVPTITVHAGHPMKVFIYRDIPIDYYAEAPRE